MFRNYLAAALRNLARNQLYSAISIFGLAIGLCAAILVGLVIRNELSYDRFIPGFERIYLGVSMLAPQSHPPVFNHETHSGTAALFKLSFSEIEAITRLAAQDVKLRRAQTEEKEKIYWADPNAFDVLRLSAVAGDLTAALQAPDGIVLTRSMARKYFGRDTPIGETIELDRTHLMTVTAVIEDLPVNGTQLESGIFASGLAAHSKLAIWGDGPPDPNGGFFIGVRTYLRLAPNASIDRMQNAVAALVDRFATRLPPGVRYSIPLIRLDEVHLFAGLNPGIGSRLAITAGIGVLILLIACINFVNLSTARSARRAMEVGVRRVSGAGRGALILQFLSESLIYVMLASVIAVALAELLLPHVNAFLNAGAVFNYWRDPTLIAWIGPSALVLGVLAGIYPAFVLSAFRPAAVLKGSIGKSGGAVARQALVTVQFAILIGLIIAAGVVHQQRTYATSDALRVDVDQILIIRCPCTEALKSELRILRGVRGAFCSSETLLTGAAFGNFRLKDGSTLAIDWTPMELGAFDLYGVRPLAGRLSAAQGGGDFSPEGAPRYVINETAVRRLGFNSPAAAIGQPLPVLPGPGEEGKANEIIGVVPDFSINAVAQEIRPTVYHADTRGYDLINVKLTGHDIPETLAAIDKLWITAGSGEPIDRFFLDNYVQSLYVSILRAAQTFGVFSCVALVLACLGLVGLSASTTERRTKEIGIRKAMGAGTGDIVRLLLWQFAQPVLWANLVAWPASYFIMNRWLQGFAYRIDLRPWIFLAAGAAALLISLLTVSAHALLVARAKPVAALRYE